MDPESQMSCFITAGGAQLTAWGPNKKSQLSLARIQCASLSSIQISTSTPIPLAKTRAMSCYQMEPFTQKGFHSEREPFAYQRLDPSNSEIRLVTILPGA